MLECGSRFNIADIVCKTIALGLALMAIYTAAFGVYDEIYQRSISVGVSVILVALATPLARIYPGAPAFLRAIMWLVDALLIGAMVLSLFWFFSVYDELESGLYSFETMDLIVGGGGLVAVIELTRRSFGWPLAILSVIAIAYAVMGRGLPWIFAHGGYDIEEVMRTVWYSFDGVFGLPVITVLSLIFIFIVFGAVLEGTGAGNVLLRIAISATGALRGGPAHAAVAASGLFGTISGSVSANVVGTGVFTIPMIKQRGFSPAFAGGVEAAASSGGQFMPPVMGAVAFFMADVTGISYLTIIVAALMPALFYYGSLFAAVWVEARRLNIEAIPRTDREKISARDWWLSLMFVVPIVVIIGVLLAGRSAAMAGLWATIAGAVLGFMNPEVRREPQRLFVALINGGEQCARIMVAVAAIGIIIGVMNLTGLGIRFSNMVLSMAGANLFLALVLVAAACLVLGMGLPTVPAYLIIVLIMGSAIEKMGVPKLLVHLFVLYYGVLSAITPPVAIAAYAAAPIARSDPFKTGLQAVRLSFVGFIVPFVLIYNPSLSIVREFAILPFVWVCFRLALSIWLITTALGGVDRNILPAWSRAIRIALGIAVLLDGWIVQVAFSVVAIALVIVENRAPHNQAIPASKAAPAEPGKDQ